MSISLRQHAILADNTYVQRAAGTRHPDNDESVVIDGIGFIARQLTDAGSDGTASNQC